MFQGRSAGASVVIVVLFLIVAAFVAALADKYVTIPVINEIFQALGDILTGASKNATA